LGQGFGVNSKGQALGQYTSNGVIKYPYPGLKYPNRDVAAVMALRYFQPISTRVGLEIAGLLYKGSVNGKEKWGVAGGVVGTTGLSKPADAISMVPGRNWRSVGGSFLTHPGDDEEANRRGYNDIDAWQAQAGLAGIRIGREFGGYFSSDSHIYRFELDSSVVGSYQVIR
jgi:hypothetical protein